MPRWAWWLMLACLLLGNSCAPKTIRAEPEMPRFIVIADDVSNDALVCVPMQEWMAVTPHTIRCIPVHTLRWMLRNQKQG